MKTGFPHYYKSRGGYYVWINGKLKRLATGPDDRPNGPTWILASATWSKLQQIEGVAESKDSAMLSSVLENWFAANKHRWTQGTADGYRFYLNEVASDLGRVPVGRLLPSMVESFLHQHVVRKQHAADGRKRPKVWTDSSKIACLRMLSAALKWAKRRYGLLSDPLEGVRRPQCRTRGAWALISPEEWSALLAGLQRGSRRPLRELLTCLYQTGARPGEMFAAERKYWDEERGALVYLPDQSRPSGDFRHKTAGKGATRVIRFSGEAREIIERLLARHKTGPLFRTTFGKRWTVAALTRRVRGICRKLSGNERLMPYSFRHTYCTEFLVAGGSVDLLAMLTGNSPAVIRKHYSHLSAHEATLRAQLDSFTSQR